MIDNVRKKRHLGVVLKQNRQVLALFCSSWCPFCQDFFPIFDNEMAKIRFEREIRVYLEDYYTPLWEEYEIEAVPTVVLFQNEEVLNRLDARLGEGLDERQFKQWLAKVKPTKI